MIDWRQYWEDFPSNFDDTEFCRQVGRTANGGVPTPEPELARVIDQVARGLKLGADDRLLDLCCGNGLLTQRLAKRCARVVGIDFSARMIELARRHHSREGVSYIEASVLDLQPQQFPTGIRFDKVCMFESLQYFQSEQLSALLDGLLALTATRTRMYFSGVLDKERIWSFFNTPERRASYERQKAEGQEIMGHWWQRDHIATTAGARDLHCQFIAQDPALNTAHYRFDVVLSRE